MFILDQILVNSHCELNLMCTSKKKKYIGLVWRLFSFCANRNMFKKPISASPTVGFSARNFKTFVNYLKAI